jgi:hypothetical protein
MLSIGTGMALSYFEGATHDWGYAQWVRPLIELMLDGVTGIADFQCGRLLGGRYRRLGPYFPPGIRWDLDAASKVPEMVAFAETWSPEEMKAAGDFLRDKWMA